MFRLVLLKSLLLLACGGAILTEAAVGSAAAATPTIDWTLRSVDGRAVAMQDMPAKFLLVYFGYTYCPDLCPTALVEIAAVMEELGALAARVQPVFISIDPERDTGEALAQYVASFAAPILPLTGDADQIAAAARQFDFHYVRYQDPGLGGYSFDHSSSFFVLDPARRLIADFATELPPEEIAASLAPLLAAAEPN
jgi:protein SCO1/2